MSPIDDLVRRLEAAGPEGWEAAYAAQQLNVTRDDVMEVMATERPFATWLGLRFDAGPPGTPLPTFGESARSIFEDQLAQPRHAFRLLFGPERLPEDADADTIVVALHNAALASLQGGAAWLGFWLAARASLAGLALGRAEIAWRFLDHGEVLVSTSSRRLSASMEPRCR